MCYNTACVSQRTAPPNLPLHYPTLWPCRHIGLCKTHLSPSLSLFFSISLSPSLSLSLSLSLSPALFQHPCMLFHVFSPVLITSSQFSHFHFPLATLSTNRVVFRCRTAHCVRMRLHGNLWPFMFKEHATHTY